MFPIAAAILQGKLDITTARINRQTAYVLAINLDSVTTICRDVVSQIDRRLSVVAVSATEGGSDRAEVFVTVAGCHDEPCLHLVNVSRAAAATVEDEVRTKLLQSLQAHRGD